MLNHQLLGRCYHVTDMAQQVLDLNGLGTYLADNVAVLFESGDAMRRWVTWCVEHVGMEHFHKAEHDTVFASSDGSAYNVNFEFLRSPEATRPTTRKPWRVEAMHITGGKSPIHERAWERHEKRFGAEAGPGFPVQVSFKVANVQQFDAVHRVLDGVKGWQYEELFVGTYGMYSYWSNHHEHTWFLKARVNMRD